MPLPRSLPARRASLLLGCLASFVALGCPQAGQILAGPVPAEVIAVVDGDTIRVAAHIWLGQEIVVLVRLRGIDAPEIHGDCEEERAGAAAAAVALTAAVTDGRVTLANVEGDKYFGRVVADVVTQSGVALGPHMIAQGLARPYEGDARQSWCSVAGLLR